MYIIIRCLFIYWICCDIELMSLDGKITMSNEHWPINEWLNVFCNSKYKNVKGFLSDMYHPSGT